MEGKLGWEKDAEGRMVVPTNRKSSCSTRLMVWKKVETQEHCVRSFWLVKTVRNSERQKRTLEMKWSRKDIRRRSGMKQLTFRSLEVPRAVQSFVPLPSYFLSYLLLPFPAWNTHLLLSRFVVVEKERRNGSRSNHSQEVEAKSEWGGKSEERESKWCSSRWMCTLGLKVELEDVLHSLYLSLSLNSFLRCAWM